MTDPTTQYSRIQHHTIDLTGTTLFTGATFTVPVSDDINTFTIYDLFDGEIGVDVQRNKTYMRVGNNINEISLGGSSTVGMSGGSLTTNLVTNGHDIDITTGDLIKGDLGGVITFNNGGIDSIKFENEVAGTSDILLSNGLIEANQTAVAGTITITNNNTFLQLSDSGSYLKGTFIQEAIPGLVSNTPVGTTKQSETTTTVNATPVTLFTIPNTFSTQFVTVKIFATNIGATKSIAIEMKSAFLAGAQIGALSTPFNVSTFTTATATINGTGAIIVTGEAAETINWSMVLEVCL